MSLDFKLARPSVFRWRLKPEVGEPSYSYFAREVADEGHDSLRSTQTRSALMGATLFRNNCCTPLSDCRWIRHSRIA